MMDEIFKSKDSILIHTFTKLGGAGNSYSNGKDIYCRIKDAITKPLELSASSIRQGDGIFDGKNNLFGPVGIILSNGTISYANEIDGGTYVVDYGKRCKDSDTHPTEIQIVRAIENRAPKFYNEFCILGYNAIGFLLCMDDISYLYNNIVSEQEFFENTEYFNLPYYFLSQGNLSEIKFNKLSNKFLFQSKKNFKDLY